MIEFADLTLQQRQCGIKVLFALLDRGVPVARMEAIGRVVAGARPLMPIGTRAYVDLTRRERTLAAAVVLSVQMTLDDDTSADQLLSFLGQRAAFDDLLIASRMPPRLSIAS